LFKQKIVSGRRVSKVYFVGALRFSIILFHNITIHVVRPHLQTVHQIIINLKMPNRDLIDIVFFSFLIKEDIKVWAG
jgi:hypothetical protein